MMDIVEHHVENCHQHRSTITLFALLNKIAYPEIFQVLVKVQLLYPSLTI